MSHPGVSIGHQSEIVSLTIPTLLKARIRCIAGLAVGAATEAILISGRAAAQADRFAALPTLTTIIVWQFWNSNLVTCLAFDLVGNAKSNVLAVTLQKRSVVPLQKPTQQLHNTGAHKHTSSCNKTRMCSPLL